jgi:hypothetical protein
LAPTPRALLFYTLLGPVSFQAGLFRQQKVEENVPNQKLFQR